MALIKSISGIRGTIGGTIGENLTPIDVVKFTAAFVKLQESEVRSQESGEGNTEVKRENQKLEIRNLKFVVGRDARVSGQMINDLVCATLQSLGVDVIDVGLSTTPTVEMAVVKHNADAGIILTASHNPMQWNALKLLNEKGEFISGEEGKQLLEFVEKENFEFATVDKLGTYTFFENAMQDHINEILTLDLVDVAAIKKANFSVAIDAVNSTGGIAIPLLLKQLGVEKVEVLFGEPNGIFPHNPEPLPEHLTQISSVIKNGKYDVGFVVDPDVDRLAMVMENGEMFGEEYTLVAISDYVLHHKKGNTVSNLSSTRALRDVSEKHGVSYYASAVGEVNVVEKMKETNAIIGGEGNGGIILPELHYGRDALVGIALFLTFMAKTKLKCSEIKNLYPQYFISKNKIELTKDINIQQLLDKIANQYADLKPNTIDGVKIDFENCWVHLRASNTEPIIRIYAEADSMENAERLAKEVMDRV